MTRQEILELIPHAGAMCLLDEIRHWDTTHIQCRSGSHRDLSHPLRQGSRLARVHLIEYGAQAIAVHGALRARQDHEPGLSNGLLAAVRDVVFGPVADVAGIDAPLDIRADCELVSGAGLIYRFRVSADESVLASGRLTIVDR